MMNAGRATVHSRDRSRNNGREYIPTKLKIVRAIQKWRPRWSKKLDGKRGRKKRPRFAPSILISISIKQSFFLPDPRNAGLFEGTFVVESDAVPEFAKVLSGSGGWGRHIFFWGNWLGLTGAYVWRTAIGLWGKIIKCIVDIANEKREWWCDVGGLKGCVIAVGWIQ